MLLKGHTSSEHTYTQRRKRQRDHRGRGWSDVATGQETEAGRGLEQVLPWSLRTPTQPPARCDASRCDPPSPASIPFLPCSRLSLSSHVPSSWVCILLQILFPPPHELPEIGPHRLDAGGLGMDKLAQSIQKVAESPNWGA